MNVRIHIVARIDKRIHEKNGRKSYRAEKKRLKVFIFISIIREMGALNVIFSILSASTYAYSVRKQKRTHSQEPHLNFKKVNTKKASVIETTLLNLLYVARN